MPLAKHYMIELFDDLPQAGTTLQEEDSGDMMPRSIVCPHVLRHRATIPTDQDIACLFNPSQEVWIRSTFRWCQWLPNYQNVYPGVEPQQLALNRLGNVFVEQETWRGHCRLALWNSIPWAHLWRHILFHRAGHQVFGASFGHQCFSLALNPFT